jgi:hypothetical protein
VTRVFVEDAEIFDALAAVFPPLLTPERPPYDVNKIDVRSWPPTLDERAALIRAPVNSGQLAKLVRSAYTQQVTHRSVTANHLLSQLLGYRPGVRDAATELVAATTLGFLLARDERNTAGG